MKGLLEYSPGNSVLHRLNPLTKLIAAFLLCVCCFTGSSLIHVAVLIALSFALAAVGGVGKKTLRIFVALLKMGAFLFILQIFFAGGETVLWQPFEHMKITVEGLHFCVLLILRLIGATLPLAIMLMLIKMTDLSGALVECLHLPYQYAFAFTTALRFIPVLSGEMGAIIEAQVSRGVELDTKNIIKKIKLILPLCVPLLVSSAKRIESSAISAELRGFSLRKPGQSYRTYRFYARDFLFLAAVVALFVLNLVF